MKTPIKYISTGWLLLALAGILSSSCKKSLDSSLDITPHDRLSGPTVFANTSTADLDLNDIYNQLPDGNNYYDPFDNWTDNSICGYAWPNSRNEAQQANYTPATITFGNQALNLDWANNYGYIRKCNVFIANVTASALPESYKTTRLAEARFLRAYFYHLLWMAYGGLPITASPLDFNKDGNSVFLPRSSSDDTYKFITTELQAIASSLPVTPQPGRVSQGAAYTLLGWVQLYNQDFAASAASNLKVMNSNTYSLFADYGSVFLDNTANSEAIFYRQYIPRVKGNFYGSVNGPTFTKGGVETSWGGVDPTQELVDDYAMDNGLPISNPASGYDPKHPYTHREQRFYESIVYDGSFSYNDTIYTRQGINSANEIDLSDHNDAGQTAYYIRKNINVGIQLGPDNWNGLSGGQNYYYFRYAEVLLNYAEAQNEAAGPDATVYAAINQVRSRVKLPNLTAGLSQTDMRTAIRRERRVELAFEDKRWFDLMRWKMGNNLNNPIHGVAIKSDGAGGFTYTPVVPPGGNHKFDVSKNYLFPIPQYAIDQNSKLKQNPGY